MDILSSYNPSADAVQRKQPLDEKSKIKLHNALKDFEAMLVNYMLKSMKSTVMKSDEGDSGFGENMLDGIFDYELSRQMSRHSNLGLSEVMYKKITGEEFNSKPISEIKDIIVTQKAGRINIDRKSTGWKNISPGQDDVKIISPELSNMEKSNSATMNPKGVSPAIVRTENVNPGNIAPVKVEPKNVNPGNVNNVKINTERVSPEKSNTQNIGQHKEAQPDSKQMHWNPKTISSIEARIQSLEPIINKAATYHGIDTSLVKAIIAAESGGNVRAQSSKNAKGVMQILDATATDLGVEHIWDPEENIFGGTKYLKQMLERFQGNIKDTIASYNAGPSAVERYNGVPPYKETRAYVQKVLEYIRHFQEQEKKNSEIH
jgi:Rod binding domain-containing protein